MTREDIISMAQDAEIVSAAYDAGFMDRFTLKLERFAALVEERTHTNNKARWYQEGVEAEREACAQTIESLPGCSQYYPHVPDIIRGRSST